MSSQKGEVLWSRNGDDSEYDDSELIKMWDESMDSFMQEMRAKKAGNIATREWNVGDFCRSQFRLDGQWYEAEIVKTLPHKRVVVGFIGYNDLQEVDSCMLRASKGQANRELQKEECVLEEYEDDSDDDEEEYLFVTNEGFENERPKYENMRPQKDEISEPPWANSYPPLPQAANSVLHLGQATNSVQHLDQATNSTQHLGQATNSAQHLGQAANSVQHLGQATNSVQHLYQATNSVKHLYQATNSVQHQGQATNSAQHQGQATNSFQHLGQATNSVQHLGQATNSVQHLGQATNSVQHLGQATNSLQPYGQTTISVHVGPPTNSVQQQDQATKPKRNTGRMPRSHSPHTLSQQAAQAVPQPDYTYAPLGQYVGGLSGYHHNGKSNTSIGSHDHLNRRSSHQRTGDTAAASGNQHFQHPPDHGRPRDTATGPSRPYDCCPHHPRWGRRGDAFTSRNQPQPYGPSDLWNSNPYTTQNEDVRNDQGSSAGGSSQDFNDFMVPPRLDPNYMMQPPPGFLFPPSYHDEYHMLPPKVAPGFPSIPSSAFASYGDPDTEFLCDLLASWYINGYNTGYYMKLKSTCRHPRHQCCGNHE